MPRAQSWWVDEGYLTDLSSVLEARSSRPSSSCPRPVAALPGSQRPPCCRLHLTGGNLSNARQLWKQRSLCRQCPNHRRCPAPPPYGPG